MEKKPSRLFVRVGALVSVSGLAIFSVPIFKDTQVNIFKDSQVKIEIGNFSPPPPQHTITPPVAPAPVVALPAPTTPASSTAVASVPPPPVDAAGRRTARTTTDCNGMSPYECEQVARYRAEADLVRQQGSVVRREGGVENGRLHESIRSHAEGTISDLSARTEGQGEQTTVSVSGRVGPL